MPKLAASLSALAATVLLGLTAPAVESASSVSVKDNFFSPKSTSVARNSTVTWRWRGKSSHNVVVTSGPAKFRSKLQRSGSFSRKLSKKGTYRLVCSIHAGMSMKITVR